MSSFQPFIDQVSSRISALASSQPGQDLERNVRALLDAGLQRLELVPREEFDTQRRLLDRALEQVRALEARIAALEAGKR
ncbi:MAG: accessory factor UbiK family protein [Rhodocyclaceae bacterium]|nr:accessory factor UbiK family protein [Rhodocyclaceae bacterium]